MSAVAELLVDYKLGDSRPKQIALKTKSRTSVDPVDLTDCSVSILIAKTPPITQACTIVDALEGKISFPLNAAITAVGNLNYSLVITLPGGETWTHTEGQIRTTVRKGSPT